MTTIDELVGAAAARTMTAPAEALALAEQALAHPDAAQPRQRARALRVRGLARCYGPQQTQGLEDLYAARALLADEPQALPRCEVERALSVAHEMFGNYDGAIEHARAALALAEEAGDAAERLECRSTLGVVLSRLGRVEDGLAIYLDIVAELDADGRVLRAVNLRNNIGINLKNLGRFDEAVEAFERARCDALAHGEAVRAAMVGANMCEALTGLGRYDESVATADAAEATLAAAGNMSGRIQARRARALALARAGRHADAVEAFDAALALAREAGSRGPQAELHMAAAHAWRALGRHEQALEHALAHVALERALFGERSDQRLSALQVQHQLERARAEAEAERRRQGELAAAHAELRTLHEALLASKRTQDALMEQLQAQNRIDALTGVANRRELDRRLAEEAERAARHGRPLAVALLDADHFKDVNDRFGHAIGDEVLRRLAALLRQQGRRSDFVARYGGEEFCLLFTDTAATDAVRVAESVCGAVRALDLSDLVPGLRLSVSIGVAGLDEAGSTTALLALADQRLYAAKRGGRDRVVGGGAAGATGATIDPVAG